MFTEILFCAFLICISIQMAYVLGVFSEIFLMNDKPGGIKSPKPVSVIICARNEANNLKQYLPQILAQRYTNDSGKNSYEVIVVDDASNDETVAILTDLAARHSHLRFVTVAKDAVRTAPGKKYALSIGVDTAANDLLVMTDADCRPTSQHWLQHMVAPLHKGANVVAGIGIYEHAPGLLNAFIRWETLHTFLQYSTYARTGKPYMAVGRNMAYTKEAFSAAESIKGWADLPSGDDDLLVQAARGGEIAIVANKDAQTVSPAKQSWTEWIVQKQRHMSTGKYYSAGAKALLGLYALTHTFSWLLLIALLFTAKLWLALGVMAARCLVYYLLWGRAAAVLNDKGLAKRFLIFDFGWMLYNFAFSPYIIWKNKQQWK